MSDVASRSVTVADPGSGSRLDRSRRGRHEDVEPIDFRRGTAVVAAQYAHIGEADRGKQRHDLVRGVHVRDKVVSLVRDELVAMPLPRLHLAGQAAFGHVNRSDPLA